MSAISTTFSYNSIIFMHAPKKPSDYRRNILLKIGYFLCEDFMFFYDLMVILSSMASKENVYCQQLILTFMVLHFY